MIKLILRQNPTYVGGRLWFQYIEGTVLFNVFGTTYHYWGNNLMVYDASGTVIFAGSEIEVEEAE